MDIKKLIAALSDKEVSDAFAASVLPTILTNIENTFSKLNVVIEKLQADCNCLILENDSLRTRVDEVEKLQQLQYDEHEKLVTENNKFRARLEALEVRRSEATSATPSAALHSRLDALESYTRVDNLIIKGLPESSYAEVATPAGDRAGGSGDTLASVLHLCENTLRVPVLPADISITHRLPKGRFDKHRPVIVRFTNCRVGDQIYTARRELSKVNRGQSDAIYINEQLTKANESLFASCRRLWKENKIAETWTWHGVIYAKTVRDQRTVKVLSVNDLPSLQ